MSAKCRVWRLAGAGAGGSRTEYEVAWRYQKALLEHACAAHKRGQSVPDSLLLVEHPRVFTLGRGASLANVKFAPGSSSSPKLVRVERGGEVTWHGPGQLVAYPILNLHRHKKDLHWYTTALEESVIRALARFDVSAGRNEVNTGVWVGPNKISAIGVTASRWHTMHGVAINVSCSLADFDAIVPCGIAQPGMSVCRLVDLLPPGAGAGAGADEAADEAMMAADGGLLQRFGAEFERAFADVFQLQLEAEPGNPAEALDALVQEHAASVGAGPGPGMGVIDRL